jgi:hypothetical protein
MDRIAPISPGFRSAQVVLRVLIFLSKLGEKVVCKIRGHRPFLGVMAKLFGLFQGVKQVLTGRAIFDVPLHFRHDLRVQLFVDELGQNGKCLTAFDPPAAAP